MRTLPSNMLRHRATLLRPGTVDAWKGAEEIETELHHVHLQCESAVGHVAGAAANEDSTPMGLLWYDCRLSTPRGLDFFAMKREAEAAGGELRLRYGGETYRVHHIHKLLDNRAEPHHYRLELM